MIEIKTENILDDLNRKVVLIASEFAREAVVYTSLSDVCMDEEDKDTFFMKNADSEDISMIKQAFSYPSMEMVRIVSISEFSRLTGCHAKNGTFTIIYE